MIHKLLWEQGIHILRQDWVVALHGLWVNHEKAASYGLKRPRNYTLSNFLPLLYQDQQAKGLKSCENRPDEHATFAT